jgi:hypothetical protein
MWSFYRGVFLFLPVTLGLLFEGPPKKKKKELQINYFLVALNWQLIEILSDHKFLPDVTGCRKTSVSDCTSSTVPVLLHNAVLLLPLDRKKQTVAFYKIDRLHYIYNCIWTSLVHQSWYLIVDVLVLNNNHNQALYYSITSGAGTAQLRFLWGSCCSIFTSSTVPVLLHNAVLLLPLDRKKQTVAFYKIDHIDKMSVQSNKKIINL